MASLPDITYFKPAGVPLRFLEEVRLSIEEAEALRLKELEELEQAAGAAKMGISRSTFQRVLSSARKKVADALLNGKAIRIEGGSFKMSAARPHCRRMRSITEHTCPDSRINADDHASRDSDAAGNSSDVTVPVSENREEQA